MKSLVEHLSSYATYHRDKRNIATHLVGIPMIVVGTQAVLARVGFGPLNAAVGATALASRYYRKLDPELGKVMTTALGATCVLGNGIAAMPMPVWAVASTSLFVGGWALQFLGHKFEGKKPAFLDDLASLWIGPLFIAAEVAFALGHAPELRAEIERAAGPTHWGTPAPLATAA
ncbi:MAG: Mpo1-like protein [Kofleriaceae bacterium]